MDMEQGAEVSASQEGQTDEIPKSEQDTSPQPAASGTLSGCGPSFRPYSPITPPIPLTSASGPLSGCGPAFRPYSPITPPTPPLSPPKEPSLEKRLKEKDALNYLDKVKSAFSNEPAIYEGFLDLMRSYKDHSVIMMDLMVKVSTLFKNFPGLIIGFNSFLPPWCVTEVHPNGEVVMTMHGVRHVVVTSDQTPKPEPTLAKPVLLARPKPIFPPLPAQLYCGGIGQGQQPLTTKTLQPYTNNNYGSSPLAAITPPFIPLSQTEPEKFSEALDFVNRVRARLESNPAKYKEFVEILERYREESLAPGEAINNKGIFNSLGVLLWNQEDLLEELSLHYLNLPHVAVGTRSPPPPVLKAIKDKKSAQRKQSTPKSKLLKKRVSKVKLTMLGKNQPIGTKKRREQLDFLEEVNKALNNGDLYDNFLRSLDSYVQGILTAFEVQVLVTPLLRTFPKLQAWLKDMLRTKERQKAIAFEKARWPKSLEEVPPNGAREVREIQSSSLPRITPSYVILPKDNLPWKSSERTPLCEQVLNDTYVSVSTWSSDDNATHYKQMSEFEEAGLACEDERFELDILIENISSTISVFETVVKKMGEMTEKELDDFRLDDWLGGSSSILHRRVVRMLYASDNVHGLGVHAGSDSDDDEENSGGEGEQRNSDFGKDMIDMIQKNPGVGVPLVLQRLKSKLEEWREAQKHLNLKWTRVFESLYDDSDETDEDRSESDEDESGESDDDSEEREETQGAGLAAIIKSQGQDGADEIGVGLQSPYSIDDLA